MHCILFVCTGECTCMLVYLCIYTDKDIWVCVCPYSSDVRLLAAIALFSHFPLWLITRVPVNPWYHHRIKRTPPSPREPISSESRTQTGKLLDIFAGPGMVKTSGLKDAPWHHPAVGRSHTPNRKTQSDEQTMSEAPEKGFYDKRWAKYCMSSMSEGIRRNKVIDRDHIVMFHSKPVLSSCSGYIPAGVATQNN